MKKAPRRPGTVRPGSSKAAGRGPVAVIGLGIMGGAISANLAQAGFAVAGYDPIPKRRAQLGRAGGRPARRRRGRGARRAVRDHVPALLGSAARGRRGNRLAGKRGLVVIETSTLPIA